MYFMQYQGEDIRGTVMTNNVYDALKYPPVSPIDQVVRLFWLRNPDAAKAAILSRTY